MKGDYDRLRYDAFFRYVRVAQALSISLSTITRIQRRLSSNDNVLTSPGKKRPRKKSKTT
ncbi:unnamed protein product [Acanthoscelides obtectus]|uniref:Uncharacterized protein n=1 Tax=Acanthoscelides obtectus TaxID=200917 RepID=A0A9P0PKW9_ACAOB|nr:unnamed protein product [Acanthoscelides obtectus]CAK1669137.1 hypothetical protein AOBTE_LOCUS26824 [Acanthoscelides obtectus]